MYKKYKTIHQQYIVVKSLLTYLWTVMILLRLFQESKNIIFTCGDSKNHSWPSPLVIFSVPTRKNNVFLLLSLHSNSTESLNSSRHITIFYSLYK
jgi:hypothetical protein